MTVNRLRGMPVLESLPDGELVQLAASGRERRLAAGEILFRQGERASVFHLVLEGRLETTRDVGGEQVLMLGHGPGGYLGAMALLTDTPYRGSTTALDESLVFEIDGEDLRRLAFTHPALLREVLPAVEAVSGTIKGIERDREKLLAVGKLAAGLAHELNNPAAAAARGVATLRVLESRRQAAFAEIAGAGAPAEQLAALASLGSEAAARTVPGERLDPIAESDREQELLEMLERRGVPDAYELASGLTEAGLDPGWVDRIADGVGEESLPAGLRFVGACAGSRMLLAEVEEATTRIAALVGAVRSYSYLDQGPSQTVDVHEGLESTLSLLGHELRAKQIEIVREFEDGLPGIEASGSELNQVWTNLIDNAVECAPRGRPHHPPHARPGRPGERRDRRQRTRHPRGPPDARLRRLLHDEAGRPGHRPRVGHRPADRGPPPRRAAPAIRARRHLLPGGAPHRLRASRPRARGGGRGRGPTRARGLRRGPPEARPAEPRP